MSLRLVDLLEASKTSIDVLHGEENSFSFDISDQKIINKLENAGYFYDRESHQFFDSLKRLVRTSVVNQLVEVLNGSR